MFKTLSEILCVAAIGIVLAYCAVVSFTGVILVQPDPPRMPMIARAVR
jgi:hypothetical protein